MKNIIYYEFYNINGSFIDALEYYICMKINNIDIIFVILNSSDKSDILSYIQFLIKDRYEVNIEIPDIHIIHNNEYVKIRCENALITDWGSFNKSLFKYDKLFLLYEYDKNNNIINYMNKYKRNNINIYNEMPFGIGNVYKNKMLFDYMKINKNETRNIGYINCISKGDRDVILKILDKYNFDKLLITTTNDKFDGMDKVEILKSHPENFFSLFDTYIYYHDGKYFDPRPRLFHECLFHKKKIIYINDYDIKDGSYYRYNDAIENGWKGRNLTKDDEIIKMFTDG